MSEGIERSGEGESVFAGKAAARHRAEEYPYRVFWSEPDGECVAVCDPWPYMSIIELSPADALAGIVDLVSEVLDGMYENGEQPPDPHVWHAGDPLYKPNDR